MRAFLFCLLLLIAMPLPAETLRLAVASNFSTAMQQIVDRFEQLSGHQVLISRGATGRHYAQIVQGAPFDLFFAADARRPALLEQQGLASDRFTYAIGQLLLWSPDADLIDKSARVLESGQFRYLAIANPKLAPYGRAAQQVLQKRGLWQPLRERMVRGENVSQAYHFALSGNAELGFVAAAQVLAPGMPKTGSWWRVPAQQYDEIRQQAVRLNDRAVSRAFVDFVRSDAIRQLIRDHGYRTP